MRNQLFAFMSVVAMLTFCSGSVRAQKSEPPRVMEAWGRYMEQCEVGEGMMDPAECRKALEYVKQVMRSHPSSIRLSVAYGGAELTLNLPGAVADAQRRFRAAIRAEPTWEEPYYHLAGFLSKKERADLFRQLLRVNPKAARAYEELITDLSVEDARGNANEILVLLGQYHEIVPFEQSNFETDQFAMHDLEQAGLFREAFAILKPIISYAESSENPVTVCALFSQTHPRDFRDVPAFQAEVVRFKSYCEERDHEFAALKLLDQQKFPEAAHELELQITTNPRYPDAFPELAKLYLQLDQKNDAVRTLHQFLEGDWSQKTKCATLKRFGELANYRVPGDQTVERIQAACDGLR